MVHLELAVPYLCLFGTSFPIPDGCLPLPPAAGARAIIKESLIKLFLFIRYCEKRQRHIQWPQQHYVVSTVIFHFMDEETEAQRG